jgi:hypothetical protein
MTIAGHDFTNSAGGRACQSCGLLWTRISGCRPEDIGELKLACTGALNQAEYDQIVAERERIWAAVWEAGRATT